MFLKVTAAAAGGLTLGIFSVDAAQAATAKAAKAGAAGPEFAPNAFLRIAPDSSVTVIVKHLEMGQGTYTGLPTLVAEELDAAWSQVRVEGAPADAKLYNNLQWGPMQGTGGSSSMANSFEQYRQAGAAARAMLVAAAAARWKVPAEAIAVKNGVVSHGGRKASFGELAAAAAKEPVPASPKLKDPKDFVYIGKHVPRSDARAKSTGTAIYTQDVKLPGMLTAVVAHPPRFGAKVKNIGADGLKGLPGIRFVVEVPNGVAVVANGFWDAKRGRDALKIEWDEATGFKYSSSDILADFKRLAGTPGAIARNDGDAAGALAKAAHKLDAAYEFPYLAHAAMEPMNCVIRLDADRAEVWNGEQFQTVDQGAIAKALGLEPAQVTIHQLYAGGSFGRRANPNSDYVLEAAAIVKGLAAQGKRGIPVKLVWTREDDMQAGYFRPAYYHSAAGGARRRRQRRRLAAAHRRPVDPGRDADGRHDQERHRPDVGRGRSQPALRDREPPRRPPFAADRRAGAMVALGGLDAYGVLDRDLRRRAGRDRRQGPGRIPQDTAREAAQAPVGARARRAEGGLGPAPRAGQGWREARRGIAVHESFGTAVAQVVEVTVNADKTFTVDRVVCAVNCGLAVNPDVVRAQMEGGIGYGLSAALFGEITIKDGGVEQSNFHDYRVLRINEMPAVEVHIVPSTAGADRRRRARRSSDRARDRQCAGRGHGQATAQAAADPRRLMAAHGVTRTTTHGVTQGMTRGPGSSTA